MSAHVNAFKDTYNEQGNSVKPIENLEAKICLGDEYGDVLEIVLTPQDGGENMQAIFIKLPDLKKAIQKFESSK